MQNSSIRLTVLITGLALFYACNQPKPQPISKDITKTSVNISGKNDSVLNNRNKNYGNATIPEPCVKCLLQTVQQLSSYKQMASPADQQHIIFDVNWITSLKPVKLENGILIVNGMQIMVDKKTNGVSEILDEYFYNNNNGFVYRRQNDTAYHKELSIADSVVKKIRRSCFWGVASAK
jgi:hypothetical protein